MRRWIAWFFIGVAMCGGIGGYIYWLRLPLRVPIGSLEVTEYHRILDKYTFPYLAQRTFTPSPIVLERVLSKKPEYTSWLFSIVVDGKRVTGQVNIPTGGGRFPVIVMQRGYVDKEIYQTGIGTRKVAEVYAKRGFLTLAVDFLGYGGSDSESDDVLEARFEKPVTVLTLLASLSSLSQADASRVGLWGHSNGGQITLSVLEITGRTYPTVLWAPVTMKFPDSFLQFVDDLPDKGAYLKNQLDIFHERYVDEDYSISAHLGDIQAPLLLHQGTADDAVPFEWSNTFVQQMTKLGHPIEYFTYPGEDHNFAKGSWGKVVERDVAYFGRELK